MDPRHAEQGPCDPERWRGAALATVSACLARSSVAAARRVRFADDVLGVVLPPGCAHRLDASGALAVVPTEAPLFSARLSYEPFDRHLAARPDLPLAYVVDRASRRGHAVARLDGTSLVGTIEPGGLGRLGGEMQRSLQGVVALARGCVQFTVTIPERHARHPLVLDFVGAGLERMLGSLAYAHA